MKLSIFQFLKSYLYLIIPIITLSSWALISLIKDDFNLLDSIDYPAFYYAGKNIFTNPDLVYFKKDGSHSKYYYLPSFASVFFIFTLFNYGISQWIYFFVLYLFGCLSIIKFNEILDCKQIGDKFNRFLILMVISNGLIVMQVFDYLQSKFITLFLILLFIEREIKIKDKNFDNIDIRFQFIQFSILIFTLGMVPPFIFLAIIYIFNNISIKSIFSKNQIKKYVILIITFIYQNFMFFLSPNLLFDFINGTSFRTNISNINIFELTTETIISEQIVLIKIPLVVIGSLLNIQFQYYLFSIIVMTIITIFLSFKKEIDIEKKFCYFVLFSLFFNVYIDGTIFAFLLPLILIFIVETANIKNIKNYWNPISYLNYVIDNFSFLIGLLCLAIIYFMPPLDFIYRITPLILLIPVILFALLFIIIYTILIIDLYFLKKKRNKLEKIEIKI